MQGTGFLPFVYFCCWDFFFFHLAFRKDLRSASLKSGRITLILLFHSKSVFRAAWSFCCAAQLLCLSSAATQGFAEGDAGCA